MDMWPVYTRGRQFPEPISLDDLSEINRGLGRRDNVWLLTSVACQADVDENLPELLACRDLVPVLGVSAEPLVEEIDLTGWGTIAAKIDPKRQPKTWEDFTWPDWVPAQQRQHIEAFWGTDHGRSPASWAEDHHCQRCPETGSVVGVKEVSPSGWGSVCFPWDPEAEFTGRFLHCWNNVGRVIKGDGETHYVSSSRGPGYLTRYLCSDGEYRHRLHWVIAGGESGPGARPCDVRWLESIRDQCQVAGVPCFVKQLGANPVATPVPGYTTGLASLDDKKGGDPAEWPEDLRVREFPEVSR